MPQSDTDTLKTAIKNRWPGRPKAKAGKYVSEFYNLTRTGKKIQAKVEGNHGTYTVSIQLKRESLSSACSCYIGGDGFCHHCEALGIRFLKDSSAFVAIRTKSLSNVQTLDDLRKNLKGTTLEKLLAGLKARGITQKAFAESIGMNPRHLGSIKSCELKNRFYNELGATKLACLWVLEHIKSKE